jgi:hypothetical protein
MRLLCLIFYAAFAIFFACSSGVGIAGRGGSETTNGVTARVYHRDGAPATGGIVRLRRADYVSRPAAFVKKAKDASDVVIDLNGRFTIVKIDPGAYCIEVNDTATAAGRGGAVLLTCTVDSSDTVDLGCDSLRPYAAITGLADKTGDGELQFYAQIRGLERLETVGDSGVFAFANLPAGNLDVRIVDEDSVYPAREVKNIKTTPGDTANVKFSGTSAFSGCVYINSGESAPLSEAMTDFPFLVRLDSSKFDFSQAGPKGDDIRFAKTDGAPLAYEIEQWDPYAKTAAIWVRIDTIHAGDPRQYIVMKWGDPCAIGQSNGTAVFDAAQGFAGVWHLNENPEAGVNAVKDRTANGYNGTSYGSMSSGNIAAGMVGAGLRFDGDDDYIAAGQVNVSGGYTLSCWIYADDLSSARRFIWKEFSYTLWYDAIGKGIRVEHFTVTDSIAWRGIYQDNSRLLPLNTATWYYLTGTYDGDKIRLYVNGDLKDSTKTIGVDPNTSKQPLSIGGRSEEYVKGVMDEVRIESKARSADWIRFCYRNQK